MSEITHWDTSEDLSLARGSVVFKALRYKRESRGSNPNEVFEYFSMYLILLTAPGPGVYSSSNINYYQKTK
jgi:hypothetical protein